MGSSLVASSSSKVNMADWEHGAGILNSSNEEEEEDEGCEQGVRSPLTARWLGATAFDSPHLYQIQPASSQMPFGNVHQMDSVVSASVDTLPFPSIAAQSHPINDDYMQFLTFGGAQKKIKQEDDGAEFHDDDEDDDDKKPAARKTEESEDDDKKPAARRTEESDDEKPPNHTRHSLSKDPFHEHESAPEFSPDDQFINPSLSFVDEEDLRTHGGNFSLAGWSAAHDLALQQQQHTGYGARAPLYAPPLTYTLGDRVPAAALLYPPPPAPESPPLRVGSAARVATRRSTAPLRQGGALRRRKATVAELTAAGTDRARAAVMTWYDRFNDLVEYSEMYGNCNVPQKYPPNPQLGIVSFVCV